MDEHLGRTQLDRRQFMASLAVGTTMAGLSPRSATSALRATAIDHVSYESQDYKKTRDFYVEIFGFQVSEEDNGQLYLWAGDALLSAKNTPKVPAPFIDHFGVTLDPWDPNAVATVLEERGRAAQFLRNDPHDRQGRSAFTRDVNGFALQLDPKDLVTRPVPAASRAPLKAVSLNHIWYLCPDYKTTRDFYRELLGTPVTNDDGQQAYLWFGDVFMIVRSNSDRHARPVVDRVAWTLADWDPNRVLAVLKSRGLDAQQDAFGKSILTKDLNGYPLELCSSDLASKP